MQINSAVNQVINKQIGMEFDADLQYITISTHLTWMAFEVGGVF